jgi:hypothetical protein
MLLLTTYLTIGMVAPAVHLHPSTTTIVDHRPEASSKQDVVIEDEVSSEEDEESGQAAKQKKKKKKKRKPKAKPTQVGSSVPSTKCAEHSRLS